MRSSGSCWGLSVLLLWSLAVAGGCDAPLPGGSADAAVPDAPGVQDDEPGRAEDEPDDSGEAADEPVDDPEDPTENEMETVADAPDHDYLEDTENAGYLGGREVGYVDAGDERFLVWIVDQVITRQRGLMYVTEEELALPPEASGATHRGMLFVFPVETTIGFWMRDTITPLDVAYIRSNGVVDSIRTMAPLDENTYPPDGPYLYALEAIAGTFEQLGVKAGDAVRLPASVLD